MKGNSHSKSKHKIIIKHEGLGDTYKSTGRNKSSQCWQEGNASRVVLRPNAGLFWKNTGLPFEWDKQQNAVLRGENRPRFAHGHKSLVSWEHHHKRKPQAPPLQACPFFSMGNGSCKCDAWSLPRAFSLRW